MPEAPKGPVGHLRCLIGIFGSRGAPTSVNDVDGCGWGKICDRQTFNVVPDGGLWEAFFVDGPEENLLAVGVLFAVGDGPDPWCEGKGESTDSAK